MRVGLVFAVDPHALLDPHASLFDQSFIAGCVACGFGGGAGAGCDRLKTEDCWLVGDATIGLAAIGAAGVEKSNRSSMPELVFDIGCGDMPGTESNAPNPLEELNPRDGCGGEAAFCAGLASKKLPPPKGGGEET